MSSVAGFTSTGSKRPQAIFGAEDAELPSRMTRSEGCRVWDERGREYLDYIMGLGAVALGYAHPVVTEAAVAALRDGAVGPLAPVLEEQLAAELVRCVRPMEQVRFLKTGAEAMAAAVRLARVTTGRDRILGCGYHGWLDWCEPKEQVGVPAATRALYGQIAFDDPERTRESIRRVGDRLAAVVFEPIILKEPGREWLQVLREETRRIGALLVVDEIKTACRVAVGGATERYGLEPDLVVMAKAMANGFPLAAVGGTASAMSGVRRTWISSTLATEWVALAASLATLQIMVEHQVPAHLARVGARLLSGLRRLAQMHSDIVAGVGGVAQMCFLEFRDEAVSGQFARAVARRGLLFKRSAYNFVSLAHDEATIDRSLAVLEESLATLKRGE